MFDNVETGDRVEASRGEWSIKDVTDEYAGPCLGDRHGRFVVGHFNPVQIPAFPAHSSQEATAAAPEIKDRPTSLVFSKHVASALPSLCVPSRC
jgi:hypothetical protein